MGDRLRPSPAMAVAFAALIVAVGGVAIAATDSAYVGTDGEISGCVATDDVVKQLSRVVSGFTTVASPKGALRIVEPGEACAAGEARLTFSQSGATGAPAAAEAPKVFATQSTSTERVGARLDEIAGKTLPGGSYLVNGAATFKAPAGHDADLLVTCSFVDANGDEIVSSRRSATLPAGGSEQITIPLSALLNDLPPGKLSIACKARPAGSAASGSGGRAGAVRAAASGSSQPSGNAQLTAQQTGGGKPTGIDVSADQPTVAWGSVRANGVSFAYVTATDGMTTDNAFQSHFAGARREGLLRGAIHRAVPSASSGAAQASFFLSHGGRWSGDGRTLPPAVDLSEDPSRCFGLSPAAMVNWIEDFGRTIAGAIGRHPVIATTRGWWARCTGNSPALGSKSPLFIYNHGTSPGGLPAGWSSYAFWQRASRGPNPGNQDVFDGTRAGLQAFAGGG